MSQFVTTESKCGEGPNNIGPGTHHPKRQGKEGMDGCHSYSTTASAGYSRFAGSSTSHDRTGPVKVSDEVNQLMSTIAEQPGKGLAPYGVTGWQLANEVTPSAPESSLSSCQSIFGVHSLRKICSSCWSDKSNLAEGAGMRANSSTEFNRGSLLKTSSWLSGSTVYSSTSSSTSEPSSPGLFSPNTQSNWMNLAIGEESSSSSDSCQSLDWAPQAQTDPDDLATPQIDSFGSLKSCLGMDGSAATPLVGALDQSDNDDDLLCATPLATLAGDDEPSRTSSGRRSCSERIPSAGSLRGPRPLMKPPPIHRSKLYKRRLQQRSKNSVPKIAEPGPPQDDCEPSRNLSSGAEHKLATFKLQTLGLTC